MFDMFSLTCLSCDMGRGTVFHPTFFNFNPDFDHGMMKCRDMFYMTLLTCSSCDRGAWHCFSSYFFFSNQTLTMGCWHVMTCKCLTCYNFHAHHVTWGSGTVSQSSYHDNI